MITIFLFSVKNKLFSIHLLTHSIPLFLVVLNFIVIAIYCDTTAKNNNSIYIAHYSKYQGGEDIFTNYYDIYNYYGKNKRAQKKVKLIALHRESKPKTKDTPWRNLLLVLCLNRIYLIILFFFAKRNCKFSSSYQIIFYYLKYIFKLDHHSFYKI